MIGKENIRQILVGNLHNANLPINLSAKESDWEPLNTHWNRTKMAKIWRTNTGKRSRRQGKQFLFNLYPLFSAPKHVRKFPYKP